MFNKLNDFANLKDEEDFNVLSAWMMMQFVGQGAAIDKIYFSPYDPTEDKGEFLKDDFSRKPNPGMILDACSDYDVDLAQSILVGDKMTDIEAGQRAGVGRNILLTDRSSSGDYECVSRLKDVLGYFGRVVSG
jgi:D-glycero-D-manno-heptose 1,7-bisphosphate phosphatase